MTDKTIIIVDDEEDLRENLKDLLEFKGYNVIDFTNGEDFLKVFDSIQAHLVLLDIQLPGIDGIGILKEVKKRKPDLPVVMVSASSARGVLAEAMEQGAECTILKPYESGEILEMVEKCVDKTGHMGSG